MAHELTFRDGVAQMFSVRETPWHQEGHTLTEAPSYEDALRLAGHDFDLELRPVFLRKLTADGDEYFVPSQYGRSVIRTDTEQELGTVGRKYTVLSNRDAFRVLVPLLDSGLATLETGGSLREGADCWLMVRFNVDRFGPVLREVFADQVIPFGLVAANHNGRRGVLLQLTPVRVVCANTLGMAERDVRSQIRRGGADARAIVVRHTADVARRTVEAAQTLFRGIVERYEEAARAYQTLQRVVLEEAEFRRLVLDVIQPDQRHNPNVSPRAIEAATKRRAEVYRLWMEGDGHTGDRSAWEAYNGAVQAIDHDTELFPTKTSRTASLFDGPLSEKKTAVLDSLMRHARRVTAGV